MPVIETQPRRVQLSVRCQCGNADDTILHLAPEALPPMIRAGDRLVADMALRRCSLCSDPLTMVT
jgi:hypothetical protein